MKLSSYLIRFISVFLRNRSFTVHVNNGISNKINISFSTRHVHLSDLICTLLCQYASCQLNRSCTLCGWHCNKHSSQMLECHHFNESASLQKYFSQWKMKINSAKTQAIIYPFDNKQKRIENSVKYLGVHFDSKLTFCEHISNTIDKANKCYRALYPMISTYSQLSTNLIARMPCLVSRSHRANELIQNSAEKSIKKYIQPA